MMKEKIVHVNLKNNSHNIVIKQNILSCCGQYVQTLNLGKKILIITQSRVPKQFINLAKTSLSKNGFKVFVLILPPGEEYKNLSSLLKIINYAIKNKFERSDTFCSLGGGVVSDLSGFAASIYYRGINFINLPTTLLSMVDAAIGGKTSINIKEGKNLLGTFYQPKIILIDPLCLKTLPEKELHIGLAEIIKYALLEKTISEQFSKKGFFNYLQNNKNKILKLNTKNLIDIITYSAKAKTKVVSKDEKEANIRAILNLGHTFAHGIEQAYNYKKYTHGEAVSIGICLAAKLAQKQRLISIRDLNLIINLILSYGLPVVLRKPVKKNQIVKAMLLDKKIKDGKLRFVLPSKQIGRVEIVSNIPINKIRPFF